MKRLGILTVLVLGCLWAAYPPAPAHAAGPYSFGKATTVTWYFWYSDDHAAFPVSYTVYAGGNGDYYQDELDNSYYDYVYYDTDNVTVHNGNQPPDGAFPGGPIHAGTYLNYYQEGYNYVNSFAGHWYQNCLKSPTDTTICVGDNPDYDYFETMHVLHVWLGYGNDNTCCTDQSTEYIK